MKKIILTLMDSSSNFDYESFRQPLAGTKMSRM